MTPTSRRDLRLQQLGMTQWVLRRPAVLQGEIAVTLPPEVRLVLVTGQVNILADPFVKDVLRTLGLDESQVLQVTAELALMLPADRECNSWCLGTDVALPLPGAQLRTADLEQLYLNSAARRALWQQICEYDSDFLPAAR